ncbi:MAG: LysM peptidoglycan-binding domain-containing protein [Spirochaetaceae bacterium]|nr:LysM peptidoglycan-binding domain-containing protein [Spirochaetaceae bacterium]
MTKVILSLFFLSAIFFVSCGSEPEPVEDNTESVPLVEDKTESVPLVEDTTPAEPEMAPGSGISMDDLSDLKAQAEAALTKASEVGAGDYYPEALTKAVADLEEATALMESDPTKSKEMFLAVIEQGDTLYHDSIEELVRQYRENLLKLDEKLITQEAPQYAPNSYARTEAMKAELEETLLEENIALAYEQYRDTYQAKSDLSDALANDVAWIKILIRDTESYMADAEDAEAYIYAADVLEMANQYLLDGVSYFDDYNLQQAEAELLYAKYYARKAALSSDYNRRVTQTDLLMMDVLGAIEDASNLTVVDEEGTIVDPDPWDGQKALQDNPLTDLHPDVDDEDDDLPQSNLKSDRVDVNGDDGVMGDEQQENYLNTAKELWARGVAARNENNLELAEQYFLQAQIFVEAYESNAVSQVYTVKWREVDTDCLWRIAGYDYIYDNPFLWPKIWRRNKRIIQNPDLIFPGQVLVIPPE